MGAFERILMIYSLAVSVILMATGLVLFFLALRYRTPECPPLFSFRLKNLKPIWKQKEWFTPKGYRLTVWSSVTAGTGALLGVIYWFNMWIGG
jgi:hypothetical protein